MLHVTLCVSVTTSLEQWCAYVHARDNHFCQQAFYRYIDMDIDAVPLHVTSALLLGSWRACITRLSTRPEHVGRILFALAACGPALAGCVSIYTVAPCTQSSVSLKMQVSQGKICPSDRAIVCVH